MKQSFSQRIQKWFAGEKEKLRGKTPGQKADYVIRYYWLWILAIGCAVYFLCFFFYRMNFVPRDNYLYGVLANTVVPGGSRSELWVDFGNYAGYDLSKKNLELNASSWFDPSIAGGINNSYYQSYVAVTDAGALDFVTMGKEGLAELGRSGRLLDLEDERVSSIREKYGDRFVSCVPYDEEYGKEEVPVGIDLSDSLLVNKYHMYEDSCVLGISAYSGHLEEVERFLDFVTGE